MTLTVNAWHLQHKLAGASARGCHIPPLVTVVLEQQIQLRRRPPAMPLLHAHPRNELRAQLLLARNLRCLRCERTIAVAGARQTLKP